MWACSSTRCPHMVRSTGPSSLLFRLESPWRPPCMYSSSCIPRRSRPASSPTPPLYGETLAAPWRTFFTLPSGGQTLSPGHCSVHTSPRRVDRQDPLFRGADNYSYTCFNFIKVWLSTVGRILFISTWFEDIGGCNRLVQLLAYRTRCNLEIEDF